MSTLVKLGVVGAGGFFGAILRYLLSEAVNSRAGWQHLPAGTIAVNLLGSLIFGVLFFLVISKGVLSADHRFFMLVGLLGSFTTFSTFSHETFLLLRYHKYLLAFGNVSIQVIGGLLMVWLGYFCASRIWS